MTLVVWVMGPLSCGFIPLRRASAYLCLCSFRMCFIAAQTWLVASVASSSTNCHSSNSRTPIGGLCTEFQKQNAKHNTLSNFSSYTIGGNLYLEFQRTPENFNINREECSVFDPANPGRWRERTIPCVMELPSTVSNPSWAQNSWPHQTLRLRKHLQVQGKVWHCGKLRATPKIAWFWLEMWLLTCP